MTEKESGSSITWTEGRITEDAGWATMYTKNLKNWAKLSTNDMLVNDGQELDPEIPQELFKLYVACCIHQLMCMLVKPYLKTNCNNI